MSPRAHLLTVLAACAMTGAVALPAPTMAAPVQKDQPADAFGRLITEKDAAVARQD